MDNIKNGCRVIADYYGYTAQSNQLVEECAELIQAVSKYRRSASLDKAKALDNYIEEIADVEIMLEQMKYLLHVSDADIAKRKAYKIQRTLSRMEE